MGYMALKAQQKKKEEDRQQNIMQQKNMDFKYIFLSDSDDFWG